MMGAANRLLIRDARAVTLNRGTRPRRGAELRELSVIPRADVLVEDGRITRVVEAGSEDFGEVGFVAAANGRVLMPGFVDCHTHACWAGSRIDEWELKLKGAGYLEILAAGGGIMSTVRAVRSASQEELEATLAPRLERFLRGGTTTVEVKSGYGLTAAHELKMLRAARAAARQWAGTLVQTALLGHAVDEGEPRFVEQTITQTLPAVVGEFPGIAVDAFCEKAAWSLLDTVALLTAARRLGCPARVHADQFNSLGMLREAIRLGARSVDHLEASTADDLAALAQSQTLGVGLPICGLHLDGRYANLRALVDAGGAVAIATNCNPGSAPSSSMPLAIAAAVRSCGLTPSEAIAAATINGAAVLGLTDRGTIEEGQRADLILLRHTDERALAYEIGGNPIDLVICGGEVVAGSGGM
jgi:imidazolonepropionase